MPHMTDLPRGRTMRVSGRPGRTSELAVAGLLVCVFVGGLAALAALVPVGRGFVPKGGGWFTPAVAGGAFTLPYRRRPALSSGCSTGSAHGGSSIWTCWRSLASFPWRC
jgi:hypothetical protein